MQLCLCDGAWLHKADASLLHWRPPLPFFPSFPPFFHSPHPTSPASSFLLSPSFHFCHRCPLSNLITQALYPPPPPVCRSLLPSCLYPWPWLAVGARHQGQISPSFLPFLPLPFFFSPSTDSTFPAPCRCSRISVCVSGQMSFFFPSFPPLVSVKRMEMIVIVFSYIVLEIFFRR